MSRRFASIAAVLVAATAIFGAPAHAAGAKGAKAKAAAAKAAAAQLAALDPQTLVLRGKRPAFFDPNDLNKSPVLSAPSALLMDADTGQVLWEKNADVRRAPASTTKILTGLLLIEHSQPGDIVTVMDPKIRLIEPSSLHLKPWEKLSSEDLLYGLMLRSANDGAVVIAQHVAGSVPRFADLMNQRARELGATNSNFVTPNGLPAQNHYSTARDLALIARAALTNPRFADAVGTPRRTIQRSKNGADVVVVTKAKKFFAAFPGADGVKTGYTRAAGHCFVGSATRDGRRLLSVVLGSRVSAIGDTVPLLSWGFQRFPAAIVARKGDVVGPVRVAGGREGEVPATAARDLRVSTDRLAPVPPQVSSEIVADDPPAVAPIAPGQEVGRLVAKVNGAEVAGVPLLAAQTVERSPIAFLTAPGRTSENDRGAANKPSRWPWIAAAAGGFLLLGVRVAATTSKSARRKRRRVQAARRTVDRGGPGVHRWTDRAGNGHPGGPGYPDRGSGRQTSRAAHRPTSLRRPP